MGKTTIAAVPRNVAKFLNLKNPNFFTGHALRVTSATVLADEGANSLSLKRHGRWKSDAVAEEYLRESKQVRKETANLLAGSFITLLEEKCVTRSEKPITNITFTNCVFNGPINFKDNNSGN